jgi:alpha-amylase
MCTKFFADGDVHKYFNPYGSPYDAFVNYMNVCTDFSMKLDVLLKEKQSRDQWIHMAKPASTRKRPVSKAYTLRG